jgi:hypothetical protein
MNIVQRILVPFNHAIVYLIIIFIQSAYKVVQETKLA